MALHHPARAMITSIPVLPKFRPGPARRVVDDQPIDNRQGGNLGDRLLAKLSLVGQHDHSRVTLIMGCFFGFPAWMQLRHDLLKPGFGEGSGHSEIDFAQTLDLDNGAKDRQCTNAGSRWICAIS